MPCKEEEDEFKFLSRWKDYVDDIKENYVSIHIHRKRKICFGGEAEAYIDITYRCHCSCDDEQYLFK